MIGWLIGGAVGLIGWLGLVLSTCDSHVHICLPCPHHPAPPACLPPFSLLPFPSSLPSSLLPLPPPYPTPFPTTFLPLPSLLPLLPPPVCLLWHLFMHAFLHAMHACAALPCKKEEREGERKMTCSAPALLSLFPLSLPPSLSFPSYHVLKRKTTASPLS